MLNRRPPVVLGSFWSTQMSLVMKLLLAVVPASVCGYPLSSQKRNSLITSLPTRCRVLALDSHSRETLEIGGMATWCSGELCVYPAEQKAQSSQGRGIPMCLVCLFSKPPHLSSCPASQALGDTPAVSPWENLQVMRGREESELMESASLWDPVFPCRVSRFWGWEKCFYIQQSACQGPSHFLPCPRVCTTPTVSYQSSPYFRKQPLYQLTSLPGG